MTIAANIVRLSQESVADPRARNGSKERVALRVVLHQGEKRIFVETENGKDAEGVSRWRRIDLRVKRRRKDRAESRCAYEALERVAATFYERAMIAEARAVQAEERAAAVRPARPTMRVQGIGALPDPNTHTKQRLTDLLRLACESRTPPEEARNAAMAVAKLLAEHGEIIR